MFRFLALLLLVAPSAHAVIANAWHIASIPQTGIPATMRDPFVEIAPTGSITVYQGFFKNGGLGGNQTGGWVIYRKRVNGTPTAWQSVALAFHANSGNNQFWKGTFSLGSTGLNAGATDIIEYYVKTVYTDRDDTYLYGGDAASSSTATEATAQASPYSYRNRPAWIFHSNNRVVTGTSVAFWAKAGYIGDINAPGTRWATNASVYVTTDGSTPAGTLGVATGTTTAIAMTYDHPETNANEPGSITTAKPMWWMAQAPTLLQGLPLGATIKYRIGFWHSSTNDERFADFNAATNDQVFTFTNGTVGDPVLTITSAMNGTLNGNYTTSKFFADEVAATSEPITIAFAPGQPSITQVEVVTNLNQRDFATVDKNANGVEDGMEFNQVEGIIGTGSDFYYRSYPMTLVSAGNYSLTLNAQRTGSYRLTARWKVSGDPAWRWFTNSGANRRDHAIVVSPTDARNINMYEINTLTIEAKATGSFIERSTFEDLFDAPNAPRTVDGRGFNLNYLNALGVNMLWFQPVHPAAIDGRENDPATGQPYSHGSPYAVKNFFEIDPWMSANYNGTDSITSAASRLKGMESFQAFAGAADLAGIGIMLDAPFNHTGFDVELGTPGVELLQRAGETWSPGDLIRDREARVFSRTGDYAQRATGTGDIAVAPDRGDFGKWADVKDVYFGRYSALVSQNPADNSAHLNEGDQFFYTDANWLSDDDASPARTANVTQQTWKYFARYATHWLEKTRPAGQNRNSTPADGLPTQRYQFDAKGIDGLRCDFGQGLPPQCWEYIINVARSKKWSFVMMSESLDGGAVTYRSNRHFDVLNENIVFPLQTAGNNTQVRQIFDDRRSAYGQGLVLTNTTSHDEENYVNPYHALLRYYTTNTLDGSPLIFMGQELGITRTNGFTFYETNFGKQVGHFKKFNSLQPAWLTRAANGAGEKFLFDAYASVGQARRLSPALRSPYRYYLNRQAGGVREEIWSIARYEQPNAAPNFKDVVFAFANLRTSQQIDTFNVNITQNGSNLFGIKSGRTYNVKNIAAYIGPAGEGFAQNRRNVWLWGAGRTGSDVLANGVFTSLDGLPATNGAWLTNPYEAQYLKLYDVTPPPTPTAPTTPKAYQIGDLVQFDWSAVIDLEGGISGYRIVVGTTPGGNDVIDTTVGAITSATVGFNGLLPTTLYARIASINNAGIQSPLSTSSVAVQVLDANADDDNDGMSNGSEDLAGTSPLAASSVLKITDGNKPTATSFTVTWSSVAGKTYRVQCSTTMASNAWTDISNAITATSNSSQWTDTSATAQRKFYRVRLVTE